MQDLVNNRQSAYHIGRAAHRDDIDQNIYDATRLYLVEDLGLDESFARIRAQQEVQRKVAVAAANSLSAAGVLIADSDVLDLGSGLGAMSEELVLRGAHVVALEPGAAWANLTRRRAERHGGHFRLIEGFGEAIPLPDASVDLVVSLQVLEHVNNPRQVLAEAWRVLRPGGHFYLACENYLAFREGHYQVPWLPLLPKRLGAIYLRLLGRPPKFLYEAVTYTTYPAILRECRRLGFLRHREEEVINGLRSKAGAKWSILRGVAGAIGTGGVLWLDRAKYTFKFGVYELFRKPKC
jgi:SAM-dependent methyltransferase